jgi:signal transduction histidine kinase
MLKKLFNLIRDAKIKYKLLFIFAAIFYVLLNSWFISFTTAKDVEETFKNLENYTLPSLIATNQLKDDLHTSLLAAYDYVSTGNPDSKELYTQKIYDVTESAIALFNASQTQEDLEFTTEFIENQINSIRISADKLIKDYETNPNSPDIADDLNELSLLRNDFNKFLEEKITIKVQTQIIDASSSIKKRADRITLYLVLVIIGVIIFIIIQVMFISKNITKPVNDLTKAAEQFGHGNFVEVKMERKDEIGLFAQTFNKMAKDIMATNEALQKELDKTKALDRQKSEFLSIAAHQLRTPMAGLKWVIKMMLEGDLGTVTEEQKHHLGNAAQNSDRMIKLINDLLDVTKIEEQEFQYKYESIKIDELVNAVVISLQENINKKKIKINITKETDLPLISVDKEKMRIVINNIIDNAIKYSPMSKQVDIRLKQEGGNIKIAIQDYGYGIPEDQMNQVFSKFFRGSNILKIETDLSTIGTGLGLYLAKDIVTKHGGDISFTSEEAKGTTFVVSLPLIRKQIKQS